MRKWEKIFSKSDRDLAKKAGFGKRQPYGNQSALIIVDVNKSFLGTQPKPAIESIEEFRTSCGMAGWEALKYIKQVHKICRIKKVPIIYTTVDPTMTKFSWGPDKNWGPEEKLNLSSQEIVKEIKPLPTEPIIKKTKPSGFFNTPLSQILYGMQIDTLFIVGTSTSGCVRATVVDAFSNRFTVFVVEECTFDRFELSHLVSLWDMNTKYANVIRIDEAMDYLTNLP